MENGLKIVESVLEDVYELTPNLRQDDINELKALEQTPQQSLLKGFIYSDECYSVKFNTKTIGMFGVSNYELPKGFGSIWFLGSDETTKHPITFVREGRNYVRKFLQKYDILINAVDSRNHSHIKWLKHIGLNVTTPIFINDYKFLQFYGTKETLKGE